MHLIFMHTNEKMMQFYYWLGIDDERAFKASLMLVTREEA
jgi:hypothetical protein